MSGLGTLRLNFVSPITVTEDNQMNQSDIKPRTCPQRKVREKHTSKSRPVLNSILIGWESGAQNIVTKGFGCVPLGWSGLESVIRDHSDHGKSNEPMTTFERIDWSSPLMCYNPIDPITEPSLFLVIPAERALSCIKRNCGAVSLGSQTQNLILLTELSK